MKKIVNLVVLFAMLLNGALFFAYSASAAGPNTPLSANELIDANTISQTGLQNADLKATVASLIRTAMGLLGIVAVIIILIGGFYWMTAGGDEGRVETGKKWIFSGIIGLAIILSAFALATFVINSLSTSINSAT